MKIRSIRGSLTVAIFALLAFSDSVADAASVISLDGSAYSSPSASSVLSGRDYGPQNLFDQLPTVGQEMSTDPDAFDEGVAYGGDVGATPLYVEFQVDRVYAIESLFYAQRDFRNNHNLGFDKIGTIEVWTSTTTAFSAADPGRAPDATITLSNVTDDTFAEYVLASQISGRYFLLRLTKAAGTDQNGSVYGGTEFRVGGAAVPGQLTVTNTNESGTGSLRQAIADAVAGDTIVFDLPGGGPHIIDLSTAGLVIDKNLTITGLGASLLTVRRSAVDGTPEFPVFTVAENQTAVISGLTISNGSSTDGAGIFNRGFLTVNDSIISGNTTPAGSSGAAGIHNRAINVNCSLTVNRSTISGNDGIGAFGGGIGNHAFGSAQLQLTINNSTISGNSATNSGGGGIMIRAQFGGSVATTIANSTISANTVINGGGGGLYIWAQDTSVTTTEIYNSTISGNSGDSFSVGGGLFILAYDNGVATTDMRNTTITGNNAGVGGSGGGIFSQAQPGTTLDTSLQNTIVAGNTAGTNASDLEGVPVDPASAYNLIGTGGSGGLTNGNGGNQVGVANARLGPLANNGGTRQTHKLLAGSPALDGGSNALAYDENGAPLATDGRGTGFARTRDAADADETQTVDIGAFEADPSNADISDKSTTEDSASAALTFHVGDVDEGDAEYVLSASSSNTTLVPNTNSNLLFDETTDSTPILSIKPAANQNGTATITVTISKTINSTTQSMSDTFEFVVSEANDAPTANDDSLAAVAEDSAKRTISIASLLANDSAGPANESGQTLSLTAVGNPLGGTVTSDGTNVYFTPAWNFAGTAGFEYTITDDGTSNGSADPKSATATVRFTITPVNDAPVVSTIFDRVINEDAGQQTVNLSAVSPGPGESQGLTITANSDNPALVPNPTVNYTVPNTTGSLTFAPAANQSGSALITVTLKDDGGTADGGADTLTRTFTVTVNPVNDAPVANAQSITLDEDTAKAITLTGTDIDGGALTFTIVTGPANGTLSGTAPNVTYTPTPNYNGADSFAFKVNDGQADSNVATVTITVNDVAEPTPTPTPTATPTPSASPSPSPRPGAQALNLATRGNVQSGENVLISGIIIQGPNGATKRALFRAIGPSLTADIPTALQNPFLELYGSGGLIRENDNWKGSQRQEIEDTTIPPSHDLESAIVSTLTPGNYTAVMSGVNDTSGVAVSEIYDLARSSTARIGNISTRGLVGAGDNVLIGGFILDGQGTARVLLRAVGPSLSTAGVPNALQDPTLELVDPNGNTTFNDNWKDTQQQEIEATTIPPSDDREAAILPTLTAGAYTVVLRGVNNGAGVALVEVYSLQD